MDDQYYEQIVRAANVVIVKFDNNLRITDFSGSSERVFGFRKHEVLGKLLTETIVPQVESSGRDLTGLLTDVSRQPDGFEYNINENITSDGRRIWMQWYNSELAGNKPGERQILSIGMDVTDRIEAERKLKQSEERFRMLSELTFEGILIHKNGIIMDCNLSLERQIGYTRDELIGKSFFDLLIPEQHHFLVRARMQERSASYEAEAMHKTGKLIPIMIESVDSRFGDQDIRVVAVRNISEQKKINKVLRAQALEMSALHKIGGEINRSLTLSQVVKASVNGIMKVIGPDHAALYLRMGNELMLQDFASKDYIKTKFPRFDMCKVNVKALSDAIYLYDVVQKSNGEWKDLKDSGMRSFALLPVMQGDALLGIICLCSAIRRNFRDQQLFLETISHETAIGIQNAILYDQVKAHAEDLENQVSARTRQLSEMVERLRELDKLKSIFLASMSHELRTPLNSIIGYTGIMLMGMTGNLTEEQDRQLTKVKNNARHLLSLINDILDVSKIEAGRVELSIEEVKVSDLVKEVMDTVHPRALEKSLSVSEKIPADLVADTDRRRLTQVVLNLVSNAVNYTEKGEISINAMALPGNRFRLSVTDTGPGIAESDIPRLFQPFQQIDASLTKKNKGTGLGLYLSRKLINLLGGEVFVKSEPGKGSEFYIEMPLKYDVHEKNPGN